MSLTRFYLPIRLIFGMGAIGQLGKEAARLGKTALLVCGSSSLRRTGVLDKALADLSGKGLNVTVYDQVTPNPRSDTVDEGARLARRLKADLIIGMGGGSAMDAAKAVTLAASDTRPLWTYVEKNAPAGAVMPALLLVPTVAASGSEANNVAVISNPELKEKRALRTVYPKTSVIDPALTLSVPPKPTAQGGVDIFCHIVEEYITAEEPSMLGDGIMETTMKMVVKALPRALARPDDSTAREDLSWASTIACSQFTSLGGGAGSMTLHGIEHPVSAYYDIAHGDGLAALLPAWMRYTRPVTQERFRRLGRRVFGKPEGIAAAEAWLDRVGMRLRLGDLGVERARLGEIAASAVATADWLKDHPRPLDAAAIEKLYEESF